MIIGKTRTNQPVEGDNDALALSLAGKDIAPKDVNATGKVSGDEIIENMTGYSFNSSSETENITREFIFTGVVKNGNKITFVVACNLTRTNTINANVSLGYFTIPQSIANKLIPSTVGLYDYLTVDEKPAWASDSSNKLLQVYSYKTGEGLTRVKMNMNIPPLNELTLNVKYYFRYEFTLLLSENLIPEEPEPGE